MPSGKTIVYVDANVVIEAHRVNCWRALAARYEIHTERECWLELGRGNPRDPDYVPVDLAAIAAQVTVHDATTAMLTAAGAKAREQYSAIDPGERKLLAWVAAQRSEVLLLTTGDRAAVMAACRLGLDSRLVALQELLERIGSRPSLRGWFSTRWLSLVKTNALLGDLP